MKNLNPSGCLYQIFPILMGIGVITLIDVLHRSILIEGGNLWWLLKAFSLVGRNSLSPSFMFPRALPVLAIPYCRSQILIKKNRASADLEKPVKVKADDEISHLRHRGNSLMEALFFTLENVTECSWPINLRIIFHFQSVGLAVRTADPRWFWWVDFLIYIIYRWAGNSSFHSRNV